MFSFPRCKKRCQVCAFSPSGQMIRSGNDGGIGRFFPPPPPHAIGKFFLPTERTEPVKFTFAGFFTLFAIFFSQSNSRSSIPAPPCQKRPRATFFLKGRTATTPHSSHPHFPHTGISFLARIPTAAWHVPLRLLYHGTVV